ncbi:enoyl-CoA hydratase/isomerase family protein [Dietzia natronolimnaea]|uniref:enoyl-CoA hydratase/isomerase family protein n=1 Tax=Dietzia natronolimnaea TaxID=161920 RepID=UPI0015F9E263|nr:enoyl-CoA hydratase/isomerase family protein [Dietzia natronolimnaea]MBB1037682.1 enoyl-CoA hydratase/isomerase family protein [Dietzia natronolimnaea]
MSETPASLISVRQQGGVRTLVLQRPEARNALSPDLRADLRVALLEADGDDETRCIVLTGAGGNFCAGGDVKRMGTNTPARGSARLALGRELVELIRGVKKPTVAAVEGHAVGAGFGLALATDLIVASETARFQLGFIKRGLAPDSAVPYLLSQQIGNRRTMYYAMTGDVISAPVAAELGIAAQVYPAEGFEKSVASFAESLANGPTAALFATRKIVQASHDLTMAQAWEMESFAASVTSTTSDHKNSVAAFKAKTPYTFQGE